MLTISKPSTIENRLTVFSGGKYGVLVFTRSSQSRAEEWRLFGGSQPCGLHIEVGRFQKETRECPRTKTFSPAETAQGKITGMSTTPPHPLAWAITGNQVYPINDLRKHSLRDCWCRPIDDEGVTVHNSLDGREVYERGERKLS